MSQQQNQNEQEIERLSKAAFSLALENVEPPPFLKSRILHRLILKRKKKCLLQFLVPALSIFAVLLAVRFNTTERTKAAMAAGLVDKDYVINFMFSPKQLGSVGSVELQLPDGVQFHSSSQSVNSARKLRLAFRPVYKDMKLPFVIRALKAERAELKFRIFDRNGKKLGDRMMAIRFSLNTKNKSAL